MIKHFILSILWSCCDAIGSKVLYFRGALVTFVGVLGWLYPSWTQAQIVTPTISALESRCQASGKVVVTGEATYLYSLTGGNIPGQLGPFDGPNVTFELLAPGNYTLTVIDPATNDEENFPVSVTGNYQQNWTFTAAVSYLPCTGTAPTVSIGSLAITGATASQQRPDYFFRISTKNGVLPADGTVPPPYDTTLAGSFPIVYPAGMGGTYEIQGRDSCGNYKTIKVTVPSSVPAPTASSSFVKFNNCDGDAEYKITASGGNAPYIFKVKSGPDQVGNEIIDPTSATFTLTAGGTYVISVTDQCGGTRDVTVTPKAYTSPTTSVGTSVGICGAPGDDGTGSIRLTTTASSVGIGPLTYTLTSVSCGVNISVVSSNFDTTFINLPRPCTYTVEVKDGCDKVNTRTVELTGPGPHSMGCSKSIQCPDGASEQYRLQMSVSVRPPYNPTPNYTFVIKDSTTNTVVYTSTQSSASYTSSGLAPGKYYLSITDACGAMCTDSIVIGTYANPTVSVDATNQCFGSGQANVIGINNRGPENGWNNIYTYRIIAPSASRVNEGPESDSPTHTGQFSSLVSGGSYTFSFNDGCKTVTTQVTIPTYTQPTWEVGFGALCGNATVANLQIMNLQPEGQIVGPYKWRIISTDSQLYSSTAPYNGTLPYPNSMGQEDSVFVGLPAKNLAGEVATYQILGNDGCKNSYQGSGKIGALPDETLLLNTTTVCADGSTLLRARVSTPIVGGTYRYYRNGVKVAESNKLFTNIVPALPGTYTVKVVASTLPDSSCVQEASEVVVQASATLVTTDPAPVCPGVAVNLTTTTAGSSSGMITFYRDKNLTQEETNPTAVTTAQTYYVKLVPTGINDCEVIDSVVVANKICVGSIGDYVWKDANDNGIQDNNEQGVAGVIVQLLNATNSNVLATDTTDASGLYGFPNLQSGTYKVKILVSSLPDTCQITPKSNVNIGGGDDTNDSDFDPISGESPTITIDVTGSGLTKDNPTIDAGLYVPCVKPSAGANQTLCVGTTTIDLKDASALEAWSKGTQPASTNATINASSGVVTGLTIAGDYYFILTYKGQAACSDTVKVTVNPRPVAQVAAKIQAICLGDTPAAYTASPSTGVGYAWYGPLADTTSALGTAIAGQTTATFTPTGTALSTSGIKYYAVVVNTTGDAACADTAFVQLDVSKITVPAVTALCHANGTPEDGTDDYMTFSIHVSTEPMSTNKFTVTATQGGNPLAITLSNGSAATAINCGLNTPLRTSAGSAGKGNVTLTITDNVTGCSTTVVVTDPGTCAVTCVQGTPSTVTYEYGTQVDITELNSLPIIIPKFDEQGGTRVLTSVKLEYLVGGKTAFIFENSAAQSQSFNAKASSEATLTLDGTGIATNMLEMAVPQTTLPGGILVPATGNWAGDSIPSPVPTPTTLGRMESWVSDYLTVFKDPRVDARWVTNATGDATDDDDMYINPMIADSVSGTFTYNTALALAPFIGTGNVPLEVSTLSGLTTTGGGGNLRALQRTRAYASAKVTYTFECILCTKPVALATPKLQTICAGSTATAYTATPSTGVEYKWYGPLADTTSSLGTAVSSATSATFTPSGAALTTVGVKYYAVVVNTTGDVTCADTAYVQLVVNAKPVIADGSATICAGESVDLTSKITNYNTYLNPVWTVGTANGTVVTTPSSVKPTGTTTYVLVAQNAAGCKDTANVVVTVNAKPNAGKDTTLACSNGTVPTSVQLSASPTGGTWSALTGNPTGATVSSSGLVSITNATAQGKAFDFVYSVNGCQDTVKVIVPVCQQPCVKPTFTLTSTPACSPDVQTYSITFSVANKNGTLKVDKGIISGNNPYTVTDIPSGATIKITDSLSAICKFDTLIVGPNCNCNPNVPTIITPNLTACEGDTFPTLKATVFGLATVEWYATPTGGTLLHTGLSFKPGGIVLGDTIFYAQARSTDPACLTDISSSRVAVTIDVNCLKEVDLALKKLISKKIASIGDTIEYKLKVWNEANFDATGVVVTDSLNAGIQYISSSAVRVAGGSAGSYNPSTYQWNIGNMAANGDTVVLTIRVKVLAHGVWFNTAEITATNEKDRDSTPGNGVEDEDDLDRQCFTVPFKLCAGEKVQVSVPAQYTNVQWFKQGSGAVVGTGNLILLEEPGSYTYTASNSTCPAEGCCPVIIEPGDNCCPAEICIPFSIKKTKKTSL